MPRVQGNAVNIHPVWVMFSLLACSEIWGPVGMLISTPVAAVVRTVVREIYYYIIGDEKRSVTAAVESDVAAGRAEKEAALAAAAAGNAPAGAPQAPHSPSPLRQSAGGKTGGKGGKSPCEKAPSRQTVKVFTIPRPAHKLGRGDDRERDDLFGGVYSGHRDALSL